ncbi:MIP/aquaporin family protein [Dysgonomonas massiliensis]|uniref:MIP/aquaporin family protein n=1 Tax=Dysgonomonas massiliensis TaxID=2040292 RepID=UPI000C78FD14|nr:MIP family channel protein [Dysgonomonas massiliensis]
MKKYLAELVGTMVLVLMGCGSAIFNFGVGSTAQVLTVAFGFGLSVVAMAYTVGKVSGCHINPAITLGVFLSKRMSGKDAGMYMLFQVLGAILGSAILYAIVSSIDAGSASYIAQSGYFATTTGANGLQPGVSTMGGLLAEIIFTFVFVLVVLGTTSKNGAGNFAGLAIGLTLVLVHIVCIPLTGTSVNPARSVGPALFEAVNGSMVALQQLWLFIVGPFIGAALAAVVWKIVDTDAE